MEANLKELKKTVVKKKADFGFCFDGDADRLMMVDEKGNTVACDIMTSLMVPYFLKKNPGSTIVYDLRSSHVLQEEILKYGGTPRRERVGHAFMKKTLRDSHACFGGELSGHFYYRDNFYADSGMITLVHMLNILGVTDTPASELVAPLKRNFNSGEVNFEVEDKDGMMRCILWPDGFVNYGEMVESDAILVVRGAIDKRPGSEEANLIVNELIPLDQLDSRYTRGLIVRISEEVHGQQKLEQLHEILRGYPGHCKLQLVLDLSDGRRVRCDCGDFGVAVGGEMRSRVDQLIGVGNLQLKTAVPSTTTTAPRGNGRSRPR